MTKTENYIRELYFILFAQKKIIIWTTVIIFVCSILIAFLWPPTYSATGSILVRAKKLEKSPEAIENVQLRLLAINKEDLLSEVNIITSPDVIERTIKELLNKKLYKKNIKEQDAITQEIYSVQGNLQTEIIPASNVVEIVYYDKDQKHALNLLQVLMNQYLQYRFQVYYPEEAKVFYTQESEKFKTDLEIKEDELLSLIRSANISDPEKEIEKNIAIKTDLEKELNSLITKAIEKERDIQYLDKALNEKDMQYFSFVDNSLIRELSSKMQSLFFERGKVLRAYNEKSENVQLINKQIDDTYALLKSEVNSYKKEKLNELKIIRDKIESLRSRIEAIDMRNVQLKEQFIKSRRIGREIDLYEYSHETFSKRREESDTITSPNAPSEISILNKAFASEGPVFPKKGVVIPLGLLVGFITGFSFGFIRQYFDHTFKKPSDVQNYVDMPVIFSIPAKED
jgi:uncharacterized protein involved in exopolysaccharide biosynthesis